MHLQYAFVKIIPEVVRVRTGLLHLTITLKIDLYYFPALLMMLMYSSQKNFQL